MRFDRGSLRDELSRMPTRNRAAFAACCAQRMIPNYERFQALSGWGDPSVLRRALDYPWGILSSDAATDRAGLKRHEAACDTVTPDMDDFGRFDFASAALDAAVAVLGTLRCLETGEVDRAIDAATAARDSVDMHVQELEGLEPEDADLEARIVAHPLYQREMQHQQRILAHLTGAPALTPEIVNQLREETLRAAGLPG
jgi:uncharacterized protein YjaG (DUF416 family)